MYHVLVLTPKPPWSLGGIEKVVKEITIRINKNSDVTVEIWCKDSESKTLLWEGVKVRTFKTFLFGLSLSMIKELKRSQKKFDIIHIHGTSNLYPFEALLAIDEWRKVIVSSHYHPKGSNLLFRLTKPVYDRLIVLKYLRKANKIVCVSKTERDELLNRFKLPKDKVRVIPNGVPIDRIKKFKSKRPPKGCKISILYFGRLEKYKKIHVIIEALRYLPDAFVFYIVGRGSYEEELRKLTKRLNVKDRVKFFGFLPEDDLYSLLHSVNVVVNLSEIEAFGIMVLEALAANKPVIVNNKGGLKELAEYFPKCVTVIDSPTPEKVAKIIFDCIFSNKIYKEKSLPKFQWENITNRYYHIIKGVLSS